MKQTIEGRIVDCSSIKQYTRTDGETGSKCLLHIQSDGNERQPQEVAVGVSGDLTAYAHCLGRKVRVEYIVHVFSYIRDNQKWLGNDIYATSITEICHEN